jgi:hypothetical protein
MTEGEFSSSQGGSGCDGLIVHSIVRKRKSERGPSKAELGCNSDSDYVFDYLL